MELKIYGPYTRKDNRQHIIKIFPNGKRQTISYPKYLMEQYLGRVLLSHETVDHIDNDFTNNDLDNLQILSRVDNIRKANQGPEYFTFICPHCHIQSTKLARYVRGNKKQDKEGPYCSRRCAGKVHH